MRWGFLGAARIAHKALAPAVREAGHELTAVAARDLARAEAFGAKRAYGDYASLIADPGIDAIYIALTNDQHLPWTLAALAAGKHVLCEKPLALNAAEVAQMQQAEAASGKRVMEAFCHIFAPQYDRLQTLLAQGAIGRLLGLQASFTARMAPEDFRWHREMGGGALFDLGCYCVSLMRLLAGEPDTVSATQVQSRGVDATLAGQLHFASGATGQFLCSFEADLAQHMLLRGTEGSIALDWPISTKGRTTTLTLNGVPETFPPFDPYVAMVTHFAEGGPFRFPLSASLAQARTLDALFAAAATGQTVRLPHG